MRPQDPARPGSRGLMWILAGVCVAAQLGGSLSMSAGSLVVWLAALTLTDRPSLKRMWMPKFWTLTIVFALLSGFLLGEKDLDLFGIGVSSLGLAAGALMVVRGALIFGLASWASRAIDRQVIEKVAGKVGLGALGGAIATALSLLPELKDRLQAASAEHRLKPGALYSLAVTVICETADLAEELAAQRSKE